MQQQQQHYKNCKDITTMNPTGQFGYDVYGYAGQDASLLDAIKLSDSIFLFRNKTIGNHGNVYEGEVRSSVYGVRLCVIKFAEISEQNIREAEILTKLGSHTNVIAIIQSGTYCDGFEDRVYIALDKCHNENLRQYLANRKTSGTAFDLNQAINFAKQIIAGVMYIHENNVIHLDLKPSNILISQNLHWIKIADFGLSIIVKSPKSKVFHRGQFGTNGYRPIESFGNGEVSMRTDIFSLGTVLMHLLSNGNDAFGCDDHAFIYNIKHDVTNTSGLLVSNPLAMEHLIKCMISKERCRRPNIWEVSDHPCWTGKEVDCRHEYFADDEIDDDATDTACDVTQQEITSHTRVTRDNDFIKRMREMGFNRKPTIVIFDIESRHLYRLDHRNASTTKMQHFSFNIPQGRFLHFEICTVSMGEYIYVFKRDGSVYRLEYCDVMAKWERLPDWIESEREVKWDLFDSIVSSGNSIFLLGVNPQKSMSSTKRSIFKYNPSSSEWDKLPDKLTITRKPAIFSNKDYIYCIGGFDESGKATSIIERLDLSTMQWTELAKKKRKVEIQSASEYNGDIYVVGRRRTEWRNSKKIKADRFRLEMYNPKINHWTELKTAKGRALNFGKGTSSYFIARTIDGQLYVVAGFGIIKYDVIKKDWSVVTSFNGRLLCHSVLVKMSS